MDGLKNLTACMGCTKKHAKYSWRGVKEDEIRAAWAGSSESRANPWAGYHLNVALPFSENSCGGREEAHMTEDTCFALSISDRGRNVPVTLIIV
ncbi:hypothetical protein N7478_008497 [Penicillium angulare]|uniref:uncharacterized protein n=1 Tax=Penicillium angulare TaxID=116970 RepID=UPI00254025A8|nr:uncharacterized protein N7478_008497 [Penicillium angulare]KAJ5273372.1 hypothetical protein N7478_008497 [Penicillium angulare]